MGAPAPVSARTLGRTSLLLAVCVLLAGTTVPGSVKADIEGLLWRWWPWVGTAYFVLFAVIAAIPAYGDGKWRMVRVFALGAGLAVCTELLQSFVPGRHPLLQ